MFDRLDSRGAIDVIIIVLVVAVLAVGGFLTHIMLNGENEEPVSITENSGNEVINVDEEEKHEEPFTINTVDDLDKLDTAEKRDSLRKSMLTYYFVAYTTFEFNKFNEDAGKVTEKEMKNEILIQASDYSEIGLIDPQTKQPIRITTDSPDIGEIQSLSGYQCSIATQYKPVKSPDYQSFIIGVEGDTRWCKSQQKLTSN